MSHPANKGKGKEKVRRVGQDESLYKAHEREGNEWGESRDARAATI